MSDESTAKHALAGLVAKLRTLDLEPGEAAVLREIVLRAREAGSAEVEGFGMEIGSLGFETGSVAGFKGTDEELAARGGTSFGFKGSDEELQALVDWLAETR